MVSRGVLDNIANRANQQRHQLATEEASKTALVLPFLQALGYDIFNPAEVVPEYTADYGIKTGEKVDYALIKDGGPVMLIECKKVGDPLDVSKASQLARYFAMSDVGIGILTDGIVYKFYSDLDADNVMDAAPFLEVDVTNVTDRQLQNLGHFSKQTFDLEAAKASASAMKYVKGMKEYLGQLYQQPDEDFVKLLSRRVFTGILTQNRVENFTQLSRLAFREFVNDLTADTFRRASSIVNSDSSDSGDLNDEPSTDIPEPDKTADESGPKRIETTVEEVQAYELVRVLVADDVDPDRVILKDRPSYCTVTLDGKQSSIFCRFYFNRSDSKRLGILSMARNDYGTRAETTYSIDDVNDIADYAGELRESVRALLESLA